MSSLSPSEPPPHAQCLTCGYSLRALTTNRCPECGREFDPADPKTMNLGRRPGPLVRFLLRRTGWWPVVILILAAGAIFTASRWPRGAVVLAPLDLHYYFTSIHIQAKLLSYTDWAYVGSLIASVMVLLVLLGSIPLKTILRRLYRQPPPPPPVNLGRRMMLGMIAILAMGGSVVVSWPYRIARIWIRQIMGMPPPLMHPRFPWDNSMNPDRPQPLIAPPIKLNAQQIVRVLRAAVMQLSTSTERVTALKLLIQEHKDVGLPILYDAAEHEPDPTVRATEVRLIGLYMDAGSLDVLLRHWEDDDPEVRSAVTDAIGLLYAPQLGELNRYSELPPLAINTTPSIALRFDNYWENSPKPVSFLGWQIGQQLPPDFWDRIDSLRPQIQRRMLHGPTNMEREAAARTLIPFQTNYRLRVAEWGVWIAAGAKLQFLQSIIDEIPPFVHRIGNPIANLRDRVEFDYSVVDKPVLHFTVDRAMAVDVQVMISLGRPWFAFPQPDDFTISTKGSFLDYHFRPVADLNALDPKEMAYLKEPRTGYPWLDPAHPVVIVYDREEPSITQNPISTVGLRWQSVIVSPERLEWMVPPEVPSDPKYQWWDRLRKVPCAWVTSRNETERFLYYDGPTSARPPGTARLDGTVLHTEVVRQKLSDELERDLRRPWTAERSFIPISSVPLFTQQRRGLFMRVDPSNHIVSGFEVEVPGTADVSRQHQLQSGELEHAFNSLLTDAGLTAAEAAGLVDCWRPQFFQTPGSRFVLLMTAEDYDQLCPIRIDPPPTELVRVGLVLTEFG